MDDIKIQFEGFSPPTVVTSQFTELLEQISREAPIWANVQAKILRAGEEFRGIIKITSQAGEFLSTASSRKLNALGRKLSQRIRRQLDTWKSTRFSEEASYADGNQ